MIILGASATYYFMFMRMTREKAINILNELGNFQVKLDSQNSKIYQDDYLIAWAKALKKDDNSFDLGDSTYSTKTGKKIQ